MGKTHRSASRTASAMPAKGVVTPLRSELARLPSPARSGTALSPGTRDIRPMQFLAWQRIVGNRAVGRSIQAKVVAAATAPPQPSSGRAVADSQAPEPLVATSAAPVRPMAAEPHDGAGPKAVEPAADAPAAAAPAVTAVGGGPLDFLSVLNTAQPSAFAGALAAAASAGTATLDAQQQSAALAARPAPTGLPVGGAVEPPATPEVPAPVVDAPAGAASTATDAATLEPGGDTDPAMADRWAASGGAALAQVKTDNAQAPVALAGKLRPLDDAGALPALHVASEIRLDAPPIAAPTADVGGPLNLTMGPAVQQMAGSALLPATAAGHDYNRESADVKEAAQTGVARLQTQTTANQQATATGTDQQIAVLRSGLATERSGILATHKAAIDAESAETRGSVTQTINQANAQAKATATDAEQRQPEGEQKSTGWWDRIKAAGHAVAGAVAGVASAVLASIRSLIASARQKITGLITALGAAIRRRIDAALQAIVAAVRRVAGSVAAALRAAQALVSRLASAAAAMARNLWELAKARLSAAWHRFTAAVAAAFARAKAIAAKIAAGAVKLAQILKLLAGGSLARLFDAIHDPDRLAAPVIAKAAPLAGAVPAKSQQVAAQAAADIHAEPPAGAPAGGLGIRRAPDPNGPVTFDSVVAQAKPITGDEATQLLLEGHIREKESPVPAAPPGETFFGGVGRHLSAAGTHFLQNWMTTLRNIVYAALTFYPVLLQEGPKLWEECKAVVGAGDNKKDPLDTFDHVLGVLRHLLNLVGGLVATSCLWALIIGAFTGPGEAVVYGACESVGAAVLIADAALTITEMGKAAYSATRPGISANAREAYLSRFAGGGIGAAIMIALVAIAFFAKSLAEKFKPKTATGVADAAEDGAKKGGGSDKPTPDEGAGRPAQGPRAGLTPDEVKAGVRMAKDIPGGGRLKLFKDGTVEGMIAPCAAVATRFRVELNLPDADAAALKARLATVANEEQAAVSAGDLAREDAAFNAADAINQELEALRLRRLNALTGVDQPTLRTLINLAVDDGELVERLLKLANNDVTKVRALLEAAKGDVNALARLSKAIDDFPSAASAAGGKVRDPRFAPFANDADMQHVLERHSMDHFDFGQVKASNSFFPKGTLASKIQDGIVEALDFIRRSGDVFPEGSPRIHRLNDGIVVQIVRDAGTIVQFFPLDGPGVVAFTRQEMIAIGKFIGRLP